MSEDVSTPGRGAIPAPRDLGGLVSAYQRASDWRKEAADLVGTGRGRLVIAKVDATGVLLDLDVPDSACTGDGQHLAQDVTRAITAARQDVAARLVESGERAFGAGTPHVDTIRDAAQARGSAPIEVEGTPEPRDESASPANDTSTNRPAEGSAGQW